MNFEINNLTRKRVDKKFLEKVAKKAFKILSLDKFGIKEVSLVIVGERRMKELNKKYMKKNRVTDVLAFDYGLPGGQGEIFICLPQARRQAKKLGHSLKKELGILLIHGILHLGGYRDNTAKEYNIMMRKQNDILLKTQKTKNKK